MGFLIGLFFAAALVWMIPVVHTGRLLRIATILLVVGTVFGPPFYAINGPIQFSLDRILWVGMLCMALIHWRLGNVQLPQLTRVDWLLLAFMGICLVGAFRGGPVPRGSWPPARWLFYIVVPMGVYMIARMVEVRGSDIRLFSRVTLGLSVYLAVTAVLEVTGQHWLVFPKHILDPDVWEFYGRGRGPLLNPIGNGVLMCFGITLATLEFFGSGTRGKLLYASLGAVLFCGAYVTLTRSVWLGALAAAGIVVLIYSPRWVRVLGVAGTILIGGAMTIGMKEQLLSLKRDKELSAVESAKSVELRPLLAVVAWEMFKDQPIIGHGYGHYFEHNLRYHDNRSYGLPLDRVRTYAQHNTYLAIVVHSGLVGISLFLGILAMLTGIGWRLARETPTPEGRRIGVLLLAALATHFCNSMFHDLLVIPILQMFLLFVAGCAVSIYQNGLAPESTKNRSPVPRLRPAAQLSN